MPLPVIGSTFGGIILGALTAFFATKIPVILATLGLSLSVYAGLDSLVGMLSSSIQSAIGQTGSISFGGHTINAIGILGAAGMWDAVNIVISGYAAVAAIKTTRVMVTALQR